MRPASLTLPAVRLGAAALVAAAGLVTAFAIAAPGSAADPVLNAIVGPGATISLTDSGGAPVSSLPAGTYTIAVDDRSSSHNFHLTGPGVNQATTVAFVGQATWTVTLSPGTYTYVCDPHSSDMSGGFNVTAPATSSAATTTATTATTATTGTTPTTTAGTTSATATTATTTEQPPATTAATTAETTTTSHGAHHPPAAAAVLRLQSVALSVRTLGGGRRAIVARVRVSTAATMRARLLLGSRPVAVSKRRVARGMTTVRFVVRRGGVYRLEFRVSDGRTTRNTARSVRVR